MSTTAVAYKRHSITVSTKPALIKRDGPACLKCGAVEDLSVDHVVPVSKGGAHDIDNFQLLCKPCNSSKGDKIIDFRPSTPRLSATEHIKVQMFDSEVSFWKSQSEHHKFMADIWKKQADDSWDHSRANTEFWKKQVAEWKARYQNASNWADRFFFLLLAILLWNVGNWAFAFVQAGGWWS